MIKDKKVLCLVVGRGGSKGLPRKNVLPLCGRPAVAWTVAEAVKSKYLDQVIISSDDQEIVDAAVAAGAEAPFLRPKELSTDTVDINPVILHALENCDDDYDYLALLQATSPLRTVQDIDQCIELMHESGAPTVLSVHETSAPPHQTFTVQPDGCLKTVIGDRLENLRRQEIPTAYQLNGAVSLLDCAWFKEHVSLWVPQTVGYIMPPERAVDIDTKLDFDFAEFLLTRREQR